MSYNPNDKVKANVVLPGQQEARWHAGVIVAAVPQSDTYQVLIEKGPVMVVPSSALKV